MGLKYQGIVTFLNMRMFKSGSGTMGSYLLRGMPNRIVKLNFGKHYKTYKKSLKK